MIVMGILRTRRRGVFSRSPGRDLNDLVSKEVLGGQLGMYNAAR
jgi:hypothetical protein